MQVKLGVLYSDASGKVGGGVATKNRYGHVFRIKAKPTNPKSSFQVGVRAVFTTLSQAWNGLTQAQRDSWNSATPAFLRSNKVGDKVKLTGHQLYQKFNNILTIIGGTVITTPPVLAPTSLFTTLSVACAAGAQTAIVTYTPAVPAGERVMVFATPAVSAGKQYVNSQFRYIGKMAAADVTPFALTTLYIAKFGAIGSAGKRINFRFVHASFTTGIPSQPQIVSVIVSA